MKPSTALPLQQHPTFGAALQLIGQSVEIIDMQDAAPVQLISRFGLRFASRGPIWDTENQDDQAAALRKSGVHVINADQKTHRALRAAGYRQIMTPASIAELDITGTIDDRAARAKGKWRNIWRRSQNAQLKIRQAPFNAKAHAWLLAADLAQQRSKRYRALPHSIIHAYATTRPKDALVFTAETETKPIAAMLFLLHKPAATYHIGWTGADGRKHGAHHVLLMHAANKLQSRGITRLDLGTVDTENTPGLARFKIGCGADIRPLGGTWLNIPGL